MKRKTLSATAAVNIPVKVWLTDGSILQNATLTGADLKVLTAPFDITQLDKIDSAYLYSLGGLKVYRDHGVTGSLELALAGITGAVKIPQEKISALLRA